MANGGRFLLLGPHDFRDLVGMAEAVDLVAQGYREAAEIPIINAPRRRVHSPAGVRTSDFPGGVHGLGVIGTLTRTESVAHDSEAQTYPYRGHLVHVLNDSKTARLLAVLIGEVVEKTIGFSSTMALRTAATSGVGFRHLAREDAETAGVFGAGGQALHQLMALKQERAIARARVYSRTPENRKRFADEASKKLELDIAAVDSPREVVKGADVIICATNTNVAVFDGDWLEPGQHVTSIVGSNVSLVKGGWIGNRRREIDDTTVKRADVIVTNWKESVVQDEQGDLFEPLGKGIIALEDIHELGELLIDTHPGRTSDAQITLHKNNNGTGVADLAIAMHIYNRAKELGRGAWIEIPEPGE